MVLLRRKWPALPEAIREAFSFIQPMFSETYTVPDASQRRSYSDWVIKDQ